MFGTWDLVRPRHWHPMASLEQSMMEDMADLMMLRPATPFTRFPSLLHHDSGNDDEFFSDLPVRGRRGGDDNKTESPVAGAMPTEEQEAAKTTAQAQDQEPEQGQHDSHAFSTYSFSNSSVLDDKGRRIVSTRRRYEDSNGRLKALHERQIEGQTMRSVWNRQHRDDAGKHEQICSNGSPEDFEAAWKQTPFGHAHDQHAQLQQEAATKGSGEAIKDASKTPAAKAS